MNKELYNNLIVIVNITLMFAFIGLSIHAFHSYLDTIAGILFLLGGIAHAVGLGVSLYKLFKDRLGE